PRTMRSSGLSDIMPDSIRAQSSTVQAMGPTQSIERASGSSPTRLTSLSVGFRPATPHHAAGSRIEPAVSGPTDPAQRPAATAAADPLDEPIGSRSRFHGFRVG